LITAMNPLPANLQPLLDRPAAVLGAGRSGRAAAELLRRLGATVELYDERGEGGATTDYRPAPGTVGLVVVSPGFPLSHPWVAAARVAGGTCLGELDLASLCWRGGVVAVTGTNGKTTLTAFLAHALRWAGRDAEAVGNIGRPFSAWVLERGGGSPAAVAVCEVSSFQAETMRFFRADAALWTNFAEDHLERHGTMADYFQAKWRLFERTVGGEVFAGPDVAEAAEHYGQRLPEGAVVPWDDPTGDLLLQGTPFEGAPARENFRLAAAWWRAAGLRESLLYAAARTYQPQPHRLAMIAEQAGVRWWDDSKATNFHATEAALGRFAAPVHWIGGGRGKGGDVAAFVARIAPRLKRAYVIGETRGMLSTWLGQAGVEHVVCGDLAEAVRRAGENVAAGDDVVLSPGFSSLDQFSGFDERGRSFQSLVQELSAPAPQ
jgi:UDP-N-acetylmuramoylalanine--D-glutamate ligase